MRRAKIALIEDNPGDVMLIKMALQENGIDYELTQFESGAEAIRILCAPVVSAEQPLIPDAILMDLNTPLTDGFEALSKLRQNPRLAQVPIAILTSSAAERDKNRAALQGVPYIEKPSELAAFLSSVANAVRNMLSQG
jgi:CheY-like chemotaxis protein